MPVDKLGSWPAFVRAATFLDVPIPALAQHAHMVRDSVAKLAPVVKGDH